VVLLRSGVVAQWCCCAVVDLGAHAVPVASRAQVWPDTGDVITDDMPSGLELLEVLLCDLLPARAAFSYSGSRSPEDSSLPGDDDPRSVHLLAVSHGDVVGAASVTWDPLVLPDGEFVHYRLRALGVIPTAQRQGVGRALVEHGLHLVAVRGGGAAWCSARDSNVERFIRWGAVALGPLTLAGSQAPPDTSHTLMRWAAGR
jgi:ribosomal protein S18 acetylase RimI-like enzyme